MITPTAPPSSPPVRPSTSTTLSSVKTPGARLNWVSPKPSGISPPSLAQNCARFSNVGTARRSVTPCFGSACSALPAGAPTSIGALGGSRPFMASTPCSTPPPPTLAGTSAATALRSRPIGSTISSTRFRPSWSCASPSSGDGATPATTATRSLLVAPPKSKSRVHLI